MTAEHKQLDRLHAQLRHDLGPVICAALEDESVTEIKVGNDGGIWLLKHGTGWGWQGKALSVESRNRALNVMASLLGKTINSEESDLSGELPLTGDRIQGSVPPSSEEPTLVIRRHAPLLYTLDDYVQQGVCEQWQVDVIRDHISRRNNIVWSGETNSGKTTALNASLFEVKTAEHVVIIEDTKEIQCQCTNQSRYKTADPHPTMREQIKYSKRRAPGRMIIGETRDEAGFELLKAWNTGWRGGMTSMHAVNARGVFEQFKQFCLEAGVPPQWDLMQSAIDLICHLEMVDGKRKLVEILEVRHVETSQECPIETVSIQP